MRATMTCVRVEASRRDNGVCVTLERDPCSMTWGPDAVTYTVAPSDAPRVRERVTVDITITTST